MYLSKRFLSLAAVIIFSINTLSLGFTNRTKTPVEETLTTTLEDWDILYLAITKVESMGIPNAINPSTGAAGLIQAMPVGTGGFVDEAIRLTGIEFTDDSRFSPDTCRLMFEIINNHHNKSRDLKKAIKLHNSRGGKLYEFEVMMNFYREKCKLYELTLNYNKQCQ